jgi:hypothetical protein
MCPVLHFDQILRSACTVGTVAPFGDDALEPELACLAEEVGTDLSTLNGSFLCEMAPWCLLTLASYVAKCIFAARQSEDARAMPTVEEYKRAMNELEAATADFQPIATFLQQLGQAADVQQFLRVNFNLQTRGVMFEAARYRIDLNNWPSAETIKTKGNRLAKAFNDALRIYGALQQEDKAFVKEPPPRPRLE